MPSITTGGIGSGLDIQGLVNQLITAERTPVQTRLDRREAEAQAKISAFGLLKSVLADFEASLAKLEDTTAFETRTATSADPDLFSATADVSASPGQYAILVKELAQAHKLLSVGFASADAEVGTGTMTVSLGTESFSIEVDDTNKTLAGIRDAINLASDNPGVRASIINVDDGSGGTESKLIVSSNVTGSASAITINVVETGSPGLAQLAYDPPSVKKLVEIDEALDALIEIDGQAVTRASNTISDAIDGVTLSLHAVSGKGKNEADLKIALDKSVGSVAVEDFVTSFNAVVDAFGQVASFDAATGVATTLLGDATVRGIESRLRSELVRQAPGAGVFSSLVAVGISTDVSGKLNIDQAKLSAALETDLGSVRDLFSAEGGLAARLGGALEGFTGGGGVIDSRTDGLDVRLKTIGEQRADLDRRIASLEQRLLSQFIAMDALVGQLRATSDFLTTELATLQSLNVRQGG
jgi:flagellar hook-associated protein 2